MDKRGEFTIVVCGERDTLFAGCAAADGKMHALARQDELDRTPGYFCRRDRKRNMRPAVTFSAEPATYKRANHAHILFVERKLFGEHLLNADYVLSCIVDGQAFLVFRPVRQRRVQLNRVVVIRRRCIDVVNFIPRCGESFFRVALFEVGRFSEYVGGQDSVRFFVLQRNLCILLFIIDQDERSCVFGLLLSFGDDDGNRLTVEIDLFRV